MSCAFFPGHHPERVLALVCAVLLAGCGQGASGRATVGGAVSLDGVPIDSGVITFLAENGPSSGATIKNGSYLIREANGPAEGTNRVEISSLTPTGKKVKSGDAVVDELIEVVPEKFNSKSELSVVVKPGRNTLDFRLQK